MNGPQCIMGLQGIHMDTLKPKNSKSMTFTLHFGRSWPIVCQVIVENQKNSFSDYFACIFFNIQKDFVCDNKDPFNFLACWISN